MKDEQERMRNRVPEGVHTVEDYRREAEKVMDAAAWTYLEGGAGEERCLRRNLESWGSREMLPRILPDLGGASTEVEAGGERYPHPIWVAPTACHRLFHPGGEMASSLGAAAMDAGWVMSAQSSTAIEELPAEEGAAGRWFQLYLTGDRGFDERLVRRVEEAGVRGLMVTVDAPVSGTRDRERKAGFRFPEAYPPRMMEGAPKRPVVESPFDPAYTATLASWEAIRWLRSITRLPIWLKGVMRVEDGRRAREEGMDGLVISNHGGRVMDAMPSTMSALAAMAPEFRGVMPLVVDGGIRRGTDVMAALATGADLVMIGRSAVYGLAVAGAVGVAHVLKILRTELEVAMLLSGRVTVEALREA